MSSIRVIKIHERTFIRRITVDEKKANLAELEKIVFEVAGLSRMGLRVEIKYSKKTDIVIIGSDEGLRTLFSTTPKDAAIRLYAEFLWTCSRCTYENTVQTIRCAMCQAPSPYPIDPKKSSPSPETKAGEEARLRKEEEAKKAEEAKKDEEAKKAEKEKKS